MGKTIPLQLNPSHSIEVDGALVAQALGLAVVEFRELMERGKIAVLCERGTGEDVGRFRASFYHGGKRARLVLDAQGQVLAQG